MCMCVCECVCVCVCVCACVCVCVRALALGIVATDKILRFINTCIMINIECEKCIACNWELELKLF